jgi:ABC-type uncharacterized transport system permease subunit
MRLALERRAERSIFIALLSPLLAIALTLATGAALFALLGKPPIEALKNLFRRSADRSLGAAGNRREGDAAGADRRGLSLCYLANGWNIGAEGQFLIGAICGGWLAVKTHGTDAGYWVLPAMLVLGALGGALYALIPALFKVRFGASEIFTSLMLVYVAELLLDYLVRGPWRDPERLQLSDHRGVRRRRLDADADRREPLHFGAIYRAPGRHRARHRARRARSKASRSSWSGGPTRRAAFRGLQRQDADRS